VLKNRSQKWQIPLILTDRGDFFLAIFSQGFLERKRAEIR